MRGEKTTRARRAGPVADDLAVGDDQAAGVLGLGREVVGLGLPAQLAGLDVDSDDIAIGRGEIDHVLVDRHRLRARQLRRPDLLRQAFRIVALVLPNFIARRRVDGEQVRARLDHVHDAVVDDGRRFLRPLRQAAGEGHAQIRDVRLVDLVERAETLLVIGAADHQPVVGWRVDEHLGGDGFVVGGPRAEARADGDRRDRNRSPESAHDILPLVRARYSGFESESASTSGVEQGRLRSGQRTPAAYPSPDAWTPLTRASPRTSFAPGCGRCSVSRACR